MALQRASADRFADRHSEFWNDPFNNYFGYDESGEWQRETSFEYQWPEGIPTPTRDGRGPDEFVRDPHTDGTGAFEWAGVGSNEADDFGERLENEGWEREGQTTGTEPATGWDTTTSTYQDESGRTVEVTETEDPSGGADVTVVVTTGG